MHDLDVTPTQISLCHCQRIISGANLVVNAYKSSFNIFSINLNTYIKVKSRIKKSKPEDC